MTILISSASYVFSDYVPGGEFQVAHALVERLARRGHRLHVLAPQVRLRAGIRGVEVREVGPYDLLDRRRYAPYHWRWWGFTWRAYQEAEAIARRGRVDVAHHVRPAFPGRFSLCWRLGVPFVYGPVSLPMTASLPEGAEAAAAPPQDLRDRVEGKIADRLNMTLGAYLWGQTMARAASVPVSVAATRRFLPASCADRAPVIPLGVDTDVFRFGEEEEAGEILYAGNLLRTKGVQYLIEAMPGVARQVPEARLVVAGSGPDRPFFEALAGRLGVAERVRFAGAIPFDEMAPLYRRCAVFCLPTLAEAFGVSLLQAMASGRPVVACGVGGVPEVVEDGGSGLLVPPRDPARLAEALIRLLRDAGLRRAMGARGRRLCEERYDWETVVDRMEEVYRQCRH
jgi:glycosyltransferase involved in cell wall biosynthesis